MSAIKKSIEEKLETAKDEIDELAEKEFGSDKGDALKQATYDAAARRLENDWVGRIAILISFMGTIFAGMAISYLNSQKLLTAEGAILIILGGFVYVGFRLFIVFYNFVSLKLQRNAIGLDIKEAEVRKKEAETAAYEAEKETENAHVRLRFMKEQNRRDQKLHQDMQLRIPFFQEAQKSMMNFFARDDIVQALQVPPTFVESVERLDDILLKRTEMDTTVDKINQRLNEVLMSYTDMCQQSKTNNELLDHMVVQNAKIMTKWQENEIKLKALQNQVNSITTSIETLMQILTNGMPKDDEKEKEEKVESIAKELDELAESAVETYTSSEQIEYKTNTVSGAPVEEEKKEDEEEDSLPPPP